MVNVSIARRYARALLEVAVETGTLEAATEQLASFAQVLQKNQDLADILLNPAFTRPQRTAVVEALFKAAGGLTPAVSNLMRLLVDRGRLGYLPDISRVFLEMADQRAGVVRGKVTSAVPLSPESLQKLEQALEKLTRRKVSLQTRVDPRVLGGVAAQVGSVVYDGTLRSQLDELKRTLSHR
ncbi:MAG TPA: ATP synthase F1 subunit delta [Myxococcales bacterium]|nr:ATP synthase F1 subunit delta [Myxococcales bacterium]